MSRSRRSRSIESRCVALGEPAGADDEHEIAGRHRERERALRSRDRALFGARRGARDDRRAGNHRAERIVNDAREREHEGERRKHQRDAPVEAVVDSSANATRVASVARAGGDDHELPAGARAIGHRRARAAVRQLVAPHVAPGVDVNRVERGVAAADEQQPALRQDRARRARRAQLRRQRHARQRGIAPQLRQSPNGTCHLISPRLRSIAVRLPYGGFSSGIPCMNSALGSPTRV